MSSDALHAPPLGHASAIEGLFQAARAERLAHGLLVRGPAGIGKFRALTWFANGMLCSTGPGAPCGSCGPCKRLAAESHADLFVVDAPAAGEEQITVGFITQREDSSSSSYTGPSIARFLSLRPFEATGRKIVLVREAERMNEAAQNALLKSLEEPTPGTVLVLESSAPDRLLDTVRSRVVELELAPLSHADTRSVLAAHGLVGEELDQLARWCAGAPGAALELQRTGALAMRPLLTQVLCGSLPAHSAARALLEIEGEYEGKTPSARARARVRAFLDLGLALLRDALLLDAGRAADDLPHGDVAQAASDAGRSLVELEVAIDAWLDARAELGLNVGAEALVERVLMTLASGRSACAG